MGSRKGRKGKSRRLPPWYGVGPDFLPAGKFDQNLVDHLYEFAEIESSNMASK